MGCLKILIAVDGSEHAKKVVKDAVRFAVPLQAEVTVLTVEDWRAVDRTVGKKSKRNCGKCSRSFFVPLDLKWIKS